MGFLFELYRGVPSLYPVCTVTQHRFWKSFPANSNLAIDPSGKNRFLHVLSSAVHLQLFVKIMLVGVWFQVVSEWKLLSSVQLFAPYGLYSPWILQSRILEWVAFPFTRVSYQTQQSNPGLPHCRWILYQLSHKGSPRILEWVAYPFSSRSSGPRSWTGVSCIAGRFFTNWAVREAMRGVWLIKPRKNQSLSANDLFTSWHINTLVWFFVLLQLQLRLGTFGIKT